MSQQGGRASSKPWARLKPAVQDPLQSVGLPSKGEKKLLDLKFQEKYYTQIIQRFLGFCTDAGEHEELLARFEALNIDALDDPLAGQSRPILARLQDPANTKDLFDVIMALRKLREGIVATKRVDLFAVQVYKLSIRLSIMVKHVESYHPAILYMIRNMFHLNTITDTERQEIGSYLVLDTACRQKELGEAFELQHSLKLLKERRLSETLKALVHFNYVQFWRIKENVDTHKAKLMEWAEDTMRLQALKCFGRSYISVDLTFLESTMDRKWADLKSKDGVGWELDEQGERVTIRRIKAK